MATHAKPITHIALIGPGLVGTAVLRQLMSSPTLASRFRVVAIANSKLMALGAALSPTSALPLTQANAQPVHIDTLTAHLATFSNPTVVDCTAHDAIPAHYPAWLARGINVVTPNKKGFSASADLYSAIRSSARLPTGTGPDSAGLVYHESTVGAGLPLLSTLSDLIRTGDDIVAIEGVLSGTLSYLFNEFARGTDTFSAIVANAKALGYTEPDPREDCNGQDVGRKVLILARTAGVPAELFSLDTLPIHNLVPEPLRALASADEFMRALPAFDEHFTQLNAKAQVNGAVLRYVGFVDVKNNKAGVELREVALDHPLAGLRGADNLVRIVTKRFTNGIVVQGAGAGDEVTAFGVVADLERVHWQQ